MKKAKKRPKNSPGIVRALPRYVSYEELLPYIEAQRKADRERNKNAKAPTMDLKEVDII